MTQANLAIPADMTVSERPCWFASHELRTPLQAIQGSVELLLEDGASGISSFQLEAIKLIASASSELEACVTRLAEIAELDDGAAEPLQRLRLADFLAMPSVAKQLAVTRQLTEAALELPIEIAPELAARALEHLTSTHATKESGGRFACDLNARSPAVVELSLPVSPGEGGEGAIAYRLATTLIERAGAKFEQRSSTMAYLAISIAQTRS